MATSNYWRLKTASFTAIVDTVIALDEKSAPNEINIMVLSGTVEIEGDNLPPLNVFGALIGESAIIVSAGQSYSLNEQQYKAVTVTILKGSEVQLSANL